MHSHRQGIEDALTTTKSHLEKLHTDIGRTLEKISSREKYLNNQLEGPLSDLKRLSDNLAGSREQYKSVSGGVTERSRLLAEIADDLEAVKVCMLFRLKTKNLVAYSSYVLLARKLQILWFLYARYLGLGILPSNSKSEAIVRDTPGCLG